MIKDGGSAFPLMPPCDQYGQQLPGWPYPENGMTLRDWFAGQALRARWGDGTAMTEVEAAQFAYQLADAMLAAREADNG